jgi:hypothetical protein
LPQHFFERSRCAEQFFRQDQGSQTKARKGGDSMKAKLFRMGVTVGSLLVVLYVLGAGKKW